MRRSGRPCHLARDLPDLRRGFSAALEPHPWRGTRPQLDRRRVEEFPAPRSKVPALTGEVAISLLRLIVVIGVLYGLPAAAASAGSVYRVQPGDTLSEIAQRYGTTPAAIAAASGISLARPILTGTTLHVPDPAALKPPPAAPKIPELRYHVQPGDTLSEIAQRYDTTPAAIAAASGISLARPILTGTTLHVPDPAALKPPPAAPKTPELRYHIQPGDTLSEIAQRYDTTPAAIAAASGISLARPILTGTTLHVPDPAALKPPPAAPKIPELRYHVQPGDTLSEIAQRYDTTPAAIAAASGISLARPILTGTTLHVPDPAALKPPPAAPKIPELRYHVQPGDTLSEIAQRYDTTPAAIAAASGISLARPILTGTTLHVPDPAALKPPPTVFYRVRAGDTLGAIALRYGVSLGALTDQNHLDVSAPCGSERGWPSRPGRSRPRRAGPRSRVCASLSPAGLTTTASAPSS